MWEISTTYGNRTCNYTIPTIRIYSTIWCIINNFSKGWDSETNGMCQEEDSIGDVYVLGYYKFNGRR